MGWSKKLKKKVKKAKKQVDKAHKKVLGDDVMKFDKQAKEVALGTSTIMDPLMGGVTDSLSGQENYKKLEGLNFEDVSLAMQTANYIGDKMTPDIPDVNIPEAPIYAQTPGYRDQVAGMRKKRRGTGSSKSSTILGGSLGPSGASGKTVLGA